MGWFGKSKKDDVVDLGERMRRQQERINDMRDEIQASPAATPAAPATEGLGFFGAIANSVSPSEVAATPAENIMSTSANPDERKRKLSRMLSGITERLEDLSNQIYHLQQRIEVLERKAGTY